jgi:hypothetical protein
VTLTNAEVTQRLSSITAVLAADGYLMTVDGPSDGRLTARIEATPEACAECLVPKQVLGGLLAQAIGDASLGEDAIDLRYPVDAH